MEKIKTFKDLKIWQKGIELVKDIYALTNLLPKSETFGLSSQMQRSAVSIPSNVAEGFKRYHSKEYRQFLYIALGSAAELETLVILAKNLNFISDLHLRNISEKIDHISRMISALLKKL